MGAMIETLRVQNYKSLKDIEIPLRPLTVLVGPNAAGKSNILDCLRFLSEMVAGPSDPNEPVMKRGGFSDVVWGGKIELPVTIACKWEQEGVLKASFDYRLSFQYAHGNTLSIAEEELSATVPGIGQDSLQRTGTTLKYKDGSGSVNANRTLFSAGSGGTVGPVGDVFRSWAFYDFLLQGMRQPQPVAKQTRLRPDGGNIATLLHWVFSEQSEVFSEVEDHLKAAIPEVEKLLSPLTEGGKTYIAWREKHIAGRIPAWNMSEGSVRLVAMLLALLVPEPPPLVAFENPDTHLHAHQMEYLAEILKAGSERSQVIITTHSPYLLDHVPPESVLIVWKEAGETKVKPVASVPHLREALKELGLGELYYAGHLGGVH